ncbi:hypothetical protein [Tenacibaculum xiamenense]|uniref:hypothetical protein n=1 Tax=Tenacibaculum xiamenense TaxID=1261553 RepID=UPI0038B666D9
MLISIENALLNTNNLVDGKTEMDHVFFLTEFASLVNFYDQSNNIKGDWSPFLLKDPLFLLGYIAKTPKRKFQDLYIATILKFEKELENTQENPLGIIDLVKVSGLMNSFFYQITEIFKLMGKWVKCFVQSTYQYNFKTYFLKNIKNSYSILLWAILSLQEQLCLTKLLPDIMPVNWFDLKVFENKTWLENKGKYPYWEIFGLKASLKEVSKEELTSEDQSSFIAKLYNNLKAVGDKIFTFLNSCVGAANEAYQSFKKEKNKYPDTMLLRTFTSLLQQYKEQINTITNRHLDFYYQDILKEYPSRGTADSVYVCIDLLKNDETFLLPVKTLFNAGLDKNKKAIEFQSLEAVNLNPAVITNAYTLNTVKKENNASLLYLGNIETPSKLKKDPEDKVVSWNTFGSQRNTGDLTVQNMGFSIASPMLYLKDGSRTITIDINFTDPINNKLFEKSTYYLSTKAKWFELTEKAKSLSIKTGKQNVTFHITLGAKDFPIEAFAKQQDGISKLWPMFRIVFDEFTDLETPPKIKSIQIDVEVSSSKSFELYNDFGPLAMNKKFQVLGPTPVKGASFIVGSKEAFSKPITNLNVTLNWAKLPEADTSQSLDNFGSYYEQYNQYLDGQFKIVSSKCNTTPEPNQDYLNNTAFKVVFEQLSNEVWENIQVIENKTKVSEVSLFQEKILPPEKLHLEEDQPKEKEGFFSWLHWPWHSDEKDDETISPKEKKELLNSSSFSFENLYENEKRNALLQRDNTPFSNLSDSGYLRMRLSEPQYGFGANLYAQVVNAIALFNAEAIAKSYKRGKPVTINHTPNIPYIPEGASFEGSYKASKKYYFDVNNVHYGSLEIELDKLKILADKAEISMLEAIESIIKIIIDFISNSIVIVKELLGWIKNLKNDFIAALKQIINHIKSRLGVFKDEVHDISNSDLAKKFETLVNDISNKDNFFTIIKSVFGEVLTELFEKIVGHNHNEVQTNEKLNEVNLHQIARSSLSKLKLKIQEAITTYSIQCKHKISDMIVGMLSDVKHNSAKTESSEPIQQLENFIETIVGKIEGFTNDIEGDAERLHMILSDKDLSKIINEYIQNHFITPLKEDIQRYELNIQGISEEYPIECFYETPFKSFKIYDTISEVETERLSLGGTIASTNDLTLYPTISFEGQLFLELNNIVSGNTINLYFELERQYSDVSSISESELNYFGYTDTGWEKLNIVSDTTNNLICSGIVTLELPLTMIKGTSTMPSNSFWLNIGVSNNPNSYAKTIFLDTNGVLLTRVENQNAPNVNNEIKANSISSTFKSIPELATIIQPFNSFGGKSFETKKDMNRRVSSRLRTKNRCTTPFDFYTLIEQKFSSVFYSKAFFIKAHNCNTIFLVKKVNDFQQSNAFTPMVSECVELKVQNYLQENSSNAFPLKVTNFIFKYVKLEGIIKVAKKYQLKTAEQQINSLINVFLSPWIRAEQEQIMIDNGLSTSQIASFINKNDLVDEVNQLRMYIGTKNNETGEIEYSENSFLRVVNDKTHSNDDCFLLNKGELLVTSLDYSKINYSK